MEEDKGGPDDRLGLNIVNDWSEEGWGRLLSLSHSLPTPSSLILLVIVIIHL